MISCIQRRNKSWLRRWLLKEFYFKPLESEIFDLQVQTFLRLAIIHIHWLELVLVIRTQFVPRFWVILPVTTDIRVEECQRYDMWYSFSTCIGCSLSTPWPRWLVQESGTWLDEPMLARQSMGQRARMTKQHKEWGKVTSNTLEVLSLQ